MSDATSEPKAGERRIHAHFSGDTWEVHEWREGSVFCAPASWHLIACYLSHEDALTLVHGPARLAALAAALRPFAAVAMPGTWPGDAMVTWRADHDPEGPDADKPPYPTYYQRGVTGGPTVADYRAALAALAELDGRDK